MPPEGYNLVILTQPQLIVFVRKGEKTAKEKGAAWKRPLEVCGYGSG